MHITRALTDTYEKSIVFIIQTQHKTSRTWQLNHNYRFTAVLAFKSLDLNDVRYSE